MQEAGPIQVIYPFSLGGISAQPAHLRHENQVADAINAVFSVVDGASKRQGSRWLASLDQSPVTFSGANWTQSTKTITKTGAFSGYTWADGDHVYIRLAGADIRWGLYRIASKTSNDAIVLTEDIADTNQTGNVTSGWPTDINYRIHTIERDESEKYIVLYGLGQIRVFDTSGREQVVRISDAALKYFLVQVAFDEGDALAGVDAQDMALATSADYTLIANRTATPIAGTSENYSFIEKADVQAMFDGAGTYTNGDKIYAQLPGRGLPSGYYEYQGGSATYAIYYGRWVGETWSKPGKYNNAAAASWHMPFTEADGTLWDVKIASLNITGAASMNDVASQFQTALTNALRALTGGSETVTVAWIQEATRGRFKITSPFDGAGATIRGPRPFGGGDQHWGRRPPFDTPRLFQDGTGVAGGSLTTAEQFTRITVPGQLGAVPDASSLPMALVRYTLGEEDGGTYFPGSWELDELDWATRKSGSPNSNPAPGIFQASGQGGVDQLGIPIADIAFHRNRLVLAGGEKVCLSQAGDLFNFYIDDATDLIDSDPIEAQLSTNAVAMIEYVVPFRRSLLIFTKAGIQFELNSPEALTPSTAAITTTTSYQAMSLRPVAVGDILYFASERSDAAILYEYFYDDVRVNNFAGDVTAHAANLLPADIRSLASSKNNQMVFVVPTDCDKIYVYTAWWQGNQKVQSTWTKWQFDASYRLVDVGVIQNDLYMLIESGSVLHLEKVPIARQVL